MSETGPTFNEVMKQIGFVSTDSTMVVRNLRTPMLHVVLIDTEHPDKLVAHYKADCTSECAVKRE